MKHILLSAVLLGFVMSCAYLKKRETPVEGAADLSFQDMSQDSSGSDSGQIDGLRTVFFALDSSHISPENQEILRQNVQWLQSHPKALRLHLEGHCDPLGSEAYNIGLGQRRARAVKQALLGLGLSESQLSVVSYGEERLFSETENHLNRRVNFVPVY